ncbi:uncharacterized protein C19orf47-like, partial [Passer montanus]|uniref:uncharacterized protein C19orf47-like n=1 Tax=Passer montanus TaxID=9160 RepID=UPI0019605EAD
MCRAASEALQPEAAAGSQQDQQDRDRDQRDHDRDHHRDHHRDPGGAAGRMITNSLSRDPAPRAPRKPPGAGISVTVPNGAAKAGGSAPAAPALPPKRRRVTAEAEGQYVISLPKGAAARGRQILRLPPAP